MLFNSLKICFVGIPKNASESAHAALKEAEGLKYSIHDHTPMRYVLSEHGSKALSEYETVCICRNPYDRFASAYRYLHANNEWRMTIDETLDYVQTMQDDNVFTMYEEVNPVLHPQSLYAFDEKGKPLVNRWIRFESLARDWRHFAEAINRRSTHTVNTMMPHINSSNDGKNWWDVLTTAQMLRISKIYHNDFVNFGYSKSFADELNRVRLRAEGIDRPDAEVDPD